MKKVFLLKYILAALLVSILITSVFYYKQKIEPETKYYDDLTLLMTEVKTLDLHLNQALLMLRFGFKEYALQVDGYLNKLETKYAQLNQGEYQLQQLKDPEIDTELKRFAYHLNKKKQIINRFKIETQQFSENLGQFKLLVIKLLGDEKVSITLENKLYQLQAVVLHDSLDTSLSSLQVITLVDKLIEGLLKEHNTQNQVNSLNLVAKSARVIVHNKIEIQTLENKVIENQQTELNSQLEKLIQAHFSNKAVREQQQQNILIVVAIFSVLLVIFLLLRLARKSEALAEVLANMEKQQFALNEHAIVSVADVKGNITYVNDKFCEISGYAREELIGKNHRIIKSDIHPPEVFKDMWHTIAHGKVWHGQIKNHKKNSGFYWVNGTIVPFLNQKGKPYQYISIRTDITRQKELEKQLFDEQHFMEKVTDTMAQGVYALDVSGVCTFWNTEAEHILGWRSDELLGKKLHEIINYQDEQGSRLLQQDCLTHKSIQNKQSYSSDAGAFTHRDGRILPIEITAVPLIEDDQVMGSVAVFNDISKRKADEKLLTEAIINAEQANQTKSDFLANMSHEIRTPMNGIIGMTNLALETDLNAEQHEYLDIVKESSNALLSIINDILDFSKIESGKLDLEKIEFNINHLLKNALLILGQRAKEKNIELSTDLESGRDIPECLVGDPGRLRQVIINLVGNAIKFTLQGHVKVKISLKELKDNSCLLLFSISDTGIGIAKDKQAAVFDSFSQADTSVSRKFGGTGSGLSISKQFIALMGGEIWLESEENIGTTFFFTSRFGYKEHKKEFPVPIEDTQTLPTPHVTMSTPTENKPTLNILLAEDNLINQKLAKKLLEKHGHTVHIAHNGLEAVTSFKEQVFDLILMDFQMPEMNGLDATEKIRELEQQIGGHIPIIAMTANAMKEDRERALQAGMDAYVPKPINIAELLSEIANFFPADKQDTVADSEDAENNALMVCDWNAALRRLGGETEILEMMATLFLEEQQSYVDNIQHALTQQDTEVLEREIHTLKGVSATLGAVRLEDKCKSLEALLAENNIAGITAAFPDIQVGVTTLIKVLQEKLA